MKLAAYISTIMAGYGAISLGLLKVFWLRFTVHFNAPAVYHEPQTSASLDFAIITILIMGGISLVALRAKIPMLVILMAVCLFEFIVLHAGYHNVGQLFAIRVVILGQMVSLLLNLITLPSLSPGALKAE